MRNGRTQMVAYTGVLFGLALVLNLFEGTLAGALGLPPGVKPGLANVVVMFSLFCISKKQALLLVVLKAGFAFLTRGALAGLLSVAGGLLSIGVMLLLLSVRKKPSVLVLSVLGAVLHNLGQMLVVGLLLGQTAWVYAPVLLVSGVGMGCLTAILLRVVLPPLEKLLPAKSLWGSKSEPNAKDPGRLAK